MEDIGRCVALRFTDGLIEMEIVYDDDGDTEPYILDQHTSKSVLNMVKIAANSVLSEVSRLERAAKQRSGAKRAAAPSSAPKRRRTGGEDCTIDGDLASSRARAPARRSGRRRRPSRHLADYDTTDEKEEDLPFSDFEARRLQKAMYRPKRILEERTEGGKHQYLVEWEALEKPEWVDAEPYLTENAELQEKWKKRQEALAMFEPTRQWCMRIVAAVKARGERERLAAEQEKQEKEASESKAGRE
eukprot:PLAT12394.2.p1 GENE.PLAT12394.2~~PLAT12394.2.p1  ORF type:complete len:245 (+),score=1.39 PLAT12394.2:134-868(+)